MNPMGIPPARILVVDDHPIVRFGIRQLIDAEPGMEICAEADSSGAALQATADSRPDLALVDLSLAGQTGLELIRGLRELAPDLPILVLSMHDEDLFAGRVLRAGARGYIMKQEAIDNLVGAIRTVLGGDIYVSEKMTRISRQRSAGLSGVRAASPEDLTAREFKVFELIGRGHNTAAIAEQLAVSVKTVETYRASIKSKLNLKNATELIRFATIWVEQI
jgi:DNA-binding NarL/FixJ family response regulator